MADVAEHAEEEGEGDDREDGGVELAVPRHAVAATIAWKVAVNLFVAKYVSGVSSASITFMIDGTGAPAFAVARRSASCVASTSG